LKTSLKNYRLYAAKHHKVLQGHVDVVIVEWK